MQLNINQPLYTGGRLRNAYGIQAAASTGRARHWSARGRS